jgi:putative membrane protein
MESQIMDSLSGILSFSRYFLSAVSMLFIFAVVYMQVTPYNEIKMIRDQGKTAPAISFGGAVLGFTLPMASAISHSVNFPDMIIWSVIAMLIQILVFVLLRFFFPRLIKDIIEDKNGAALFIAVLSLAAGIIDAACMTY